MRPTRSPLPSRRVVLNGVEMDVLEICNACDAAPMVEGDPRGYCAGCAAEADAAPGPRS